MFLKLLIQKLTLLIFVAVSAGIAPRGDDDQQLCEQLRAQGAAPTQPTLPIVKLMMVQSRSHNIISIG